MRGDVVGELLAAKDGAAQAVAECERLRAEGTLDEQTLAPLLGRYVLAKYRLTPDEGAGLGLEALAEASLAKALAANPEGVRLSDTAANCDGADSVVVKQALLMVALQKDFSVTLDGFALAFAETVEDLAKLVAAQMGEEGGKEPA